MPTHTLVDLGARVALVTAMFAMGANAQTADDPHRPLPVPDGTYGTPGLVERVAAMYEAKSAPSVDGVMSFYADPQTIHSDAVLGWSFDGWDTLNGLFAQYMPAFGTGVSYSTRVLGDERSAIVYMIDTPEIFGGEINAVSAIDFDADGRIVRALDYWDGRNFGAEAVAGMKHGPDRFPATFGEDRVPTQADPAMQDLAARINAAFAAGDATAATALFDENATYEDYTLHVKLRGRAAIERYLDRAMATLPYAQDPGIRHVVGSATGGGYEWTAGGPVGLGITALGVGADGEVESFVAVYDGLLLGDEELSAAALLALDLDR